MGKNTRIPKILKSRWHTAIWTACCRDSGSLAMAASMEVVVVPMLLPRVRGYIRSRLITPMPTRGVRVEVNTLELCSRKVRIVPTTRNMYLKRA